VKTVQNKDSENFGKPFIKGVVEVATDNEGLNIIPVDFMYVAEKTKKGVANKTYSEMMKIINGGKTVLNDGFENATMVSIDTAIAMNDFVAADDSMVSQVILQGGFINVVSKIQENESERCKFKADVVVTNVNRVEANPEKFIDADYVSVRCAAFDFRNALLPMELVVKNPGGMSYFENLDVTNANPVYTQVWGVLNFKTVSVNVTEESAFGEAAVTKRDRKVKHWTITGASKVPYDFGDDNVMTVAELTKAMQDREVLLADVRKRRETYLAEKAANATPSAFGSAPAPAMGAVAPGGFSF
jgi:hypothetical protein